MQSKKVLLIGSYSPENEGKPEIIDRDYYRQGWIFKDEAAKAENHVFEDLEMVERLASASPEIIAVLDTMSKRDQLDLLPKVAAAFKYVAEEDEDVVGVTVTTAIPLDDELRQTITKKCEQDFGRKVFLIEQVDPSIVGGLVLEARGERRDISVKTQLRIAQETLANSANSYGGEA